MPTFCIKYTEEKKKTMKTLCVTLILDKVWVLGNITLETREEGAEPGKFSVINT